MAVPKTNVHHKHIVDQTYQNVLGLQIDINRNAQTHKAMAQVQAPNLEKLQKHINDAIIAYTTRLDWVSDWLADTQKKVELNTYLSKMGWTETDITNITSYLREQINIFAAMSKKNYSEIIVACDFLIGTVDAPENAWPT